AGTRPQVIALSPDGALLVTSGKTPELVVIDPRTGKILQRVQLPSGAGTEASGAVSEFILKPDKGAQASYNGLIFSPDGKRIFLSSETGSIKVFTVGEDRKVVPSRSLPLPKSGLTGHESEVPAGLALAADGARLYVVLNLSNRLLEMDLQTGKTLRIFDVGVAPYEVVLARGKACVSNWGGRR